MAEVDAVSAARRTGRQELAELYGTLREVLTVGVLSEEFHAVDATDDGVLLTLPGGQRFWLTAEAVTAPAAPAGQLITAAEGEAQYGVPRRRRLLLARQGKIARRRLPGQQRRVYLEEAAVRMAAVAEHDRRARLLASGRHLSPWPADRLLPLLIREARLLAATPVDPAAVEAVRQTISDTVDQAATLVMLTGQPGGFRHAGEASVR